MLKFRIKCIGGHPSQFLIGINVTDISGALTPWLMIHFHTWHWRMGWFEWVEKKEEL